MEITRVGNEEEKGEERREERRKKRRRWLEGMELEAFSACKLGWRWRRKRFNRIHQPHCLHTTFPLSPKFDALWPSKCLICC